MYLIKRTTNQEEMMLQPPFGPGFNNLPESCTMEVWGSSMTQDGADYCEFRLFGESGQPICKKRIGGY